MLQNFRSVVDDPIPRFSSIGAGTIAVRPGEADVSSDRLSSIVGPEPESSANNFAKTKMTTSPEAAAPTRRLEQVALPQSSRESARAARARERATISVNAAKFR